MTSQVNCILINYTNKGGEFTSELTSQYCCKRLKHELQKTPLKKRFRQSVGGIHEMDGKMLDIHKWLKNCPFCKAKIIRKKIEIHSIPYEYLIQQEINTS